MPSNTPDLSPQPAPDYISDTAIIERALRDAVAGPDDDFGAGRRFFLRQQPTDGTPDDTDPSIDPAAVVESGSHVAFEFDDGECVTALRRDMPLVVVLPGMHVMEVYRDTESVRAAREVVVLRERLALERYALRAALASGYVPAVELDKQLLQIRTVESQLTVAYSRLAALV